MRPAARATIMQHGAHLRSVRPKATGPFSISGHRWDYRGALRPPIVFLQRALF